MLQQQDSRRAYNDTLAKGMYLLIRQDIHACEVWTRQYPSDTGDLPDPQPPIPGSIIDPNLTLSPLQDYDDSLPVAGPSGTSYTPAPEDELLDYDMDDATADPFREPGDSPIAPVPDLPTA